MIDGDGGGREGRSVSEAYVRVGGIMAPVTGGAGNAETHVLGVLY